LRHAHHVFDSDPQDRCSCDVILTGGRWPTRRKLTVNHGERQADAGWRLRRGSCPGCLVQVPQDDVSHLRCCGQLPRNGPPEKFGRLCCSPGLLSSATLEAQELEPAVRGSAMKTGSVSPGPSSPSLSQHRLYLEDQVSRLESVILQRPSDGRSHSARTSRASGESAPLLATEAEVPSCVSQSCAAAIP